MLHTKFSVKGLLSAHSSWYKMAKEGKFVYNVGNILIILKVI